MTAPLLEARGLRKSFEMAGRQIDVLRGVDLSVAAGDMVAIVGRSGSGKSTLLHLLGALDAPSSGSVHYHGNALTERSDDEVAQFRNRTIGFVFQFHHLLPELTALENVLMPALIARKSRAEMRPHAVTLLERVGLSDRLDHHPGELSGGEQQRVALARALVMSPQVVFADEPTGNLDGQTAEEMHELMDRLNRETGTSFVVVTHNRELAERMGRVLEMREGVVRVMEAS
ncbi:MAG TPA: lipoprotein-releasing system ATP-binding protein LolD [Myxococcales bacterium]|nr:lipoprotein-releasing system ATP-binding protein LolD [Myxococcales bacterium]